MRCLRVNLSHSGCGRALRAERGLHLTLCGAASPSEVIERVLDEALSDVDVENMALDLMMHRANRYRGLSRERALGRMYGFLGRRGFEASVAREVAQKVWTTIENEKVEQR